MSANPYGHLSLEVPAAECAETHPVRFEFAGNLTEFLFGRSRAPAYAAYPYVR
jgi:hypothetical protein